MIRDLLFSSTFSASWFIISSIWAVILIYRTRKIETKTKIIICVFLYIFLCIRSYSLQSFYFLNKFFRIYEQLFTNPIKSFPIATIWMYVGKLIADYSEKIRCIKTEKVVTVTIVFSILLYIEWKYAYELTGIINYTIYFMLMPFSVCVLLLLLKIDPSSISIKTDFIIKESIVSYPLHINTLKIIQYLCNILHINSALLEFASVLFICHFVTIMIIKLERNDKFAFLKYSH